MPEVKNGWSGPEIPLEVQALLLMKYYRKSVAIAAANFAGWHKMVEARLGPAEESHQMAKALEDDPTYMRILGKLAANHEEFRDRAFRQTNENLMEEVIDEMDDLVTWLAFNLWVEDGAEIPDFVQEAYGMVESSEEE